MLFALDLGVQFDQTINGFFGLVSEIMRQHRLGARGVTGLVGRHDQCSLPMKLSVFGRELFEELDIPESGLASSVYPFAQNTAVILADQCGIESFGRGSIQIVDQATLPCDMGFDRFEKIDLAADLCPVFLSHSHE